MTVNTYTQLFNLNSITGSLWYWMGACYCLSVLSFGNFDHKDIFVQQAPTLSTVY